MFLKQTSYKPRSNSGSSQNTPNVDTPKEESKPATATANTTTVSGAVTAAAAGRRRSSAGSAQYAGLHGYKRNSQDAGGDRKASFAEQKPGGGGILAGAWNSFTKGT